jgi:hypothetical protein
MSFLANLADQINNQFSPGENTSANLDAIVSGQSSTNGFSLGDLASNMDRSTERRYLEDGFLRTDPYTTDIKAFEALLQQPSATILIKKSMFSSIGENYRPDFMDQDEKLYYKSMKVLFQNKCRQIAVLEKLSKIQQVTAAIGNVSEQLLPLIITLSDQLSATNSGSNPNLFGSVNTNGEISSFNTVIERIRRLSAFNQGTNYTNWITDPTLLFQSQLGQGTGVIEITNFTTINTVVTNDIKNPGNFSFSLVDPYGASVISEWDIEKAISDATNAYYNHKIFQFGQQSIDQVVNDARTRLSQMRAARGASDIDFMTAPNTAISNPVTAIIENNGVQIAFTYSSVLGLGGGVSVAAPYLQGGSIAGFQGLSTTPSTAGIGPDATINTLTSQTELNVFQQVINAIYQQIQLNTSSQNAFQTSNKVTNYARRKLRFNFAGKLIVQPMDIVHVYINSRSRLDNKLLSGMQNMFAGAGLLQNLNQSTYDLTNAVSTLFNPSGNIQMQAEKAAFVGPNFPNFLWSLLRGQFVTEKEGTHVFAGLIESAPENWADGKYTIDVRGRDNTYYFELGKVNWKPGVDVFNGPLFDPLTPFKTNFDTITSNAKSNTLELLDENKYLLGGSTDGTQPLVKFKLGPNAGLAARSDNIIQDRNIDKVTGMPGKIFYAPDGLVYKWKEGIGVLVQYGSSLDINDPSKTGNPALTKEPFAGQDVMNVISLLITGQPYNFANYWRAVSNFDGFNRDPQSQQDAAYSYYASLKTDLVKNNITWGNFIPFKNLKMDEQSFAKMMQNQISATQRNQQLDNVVQKLADAQNQINLFGQAAILDPSLSSQFNTNVSTAKSIASQLQTQANNLIQQIQSQNQGLSNSLGPSGDASYDSGGFSSGNLSGQSLSDGSQRKSFRQQVNYLTRRMSYNVRGNEDKNLFIVDDTYDKDYDIIAYEESLADGIPLYNNEFNSVKDKIITTADLLNLEVFADTQGHIRARAPHYNDMPSSVFYRMMYLKRAYGIQIFPQFLEDIFENQINTLVQRVEVLENEIRLNCAVLGFQTDAACVSFIVNGGSISGNNTGPTTGNAETFSFLSNEGTAPNYNFRITDLAALLQAANPDASGAAISLASQATNNQQIFTNIQRTQFVISSLTSRTINQSGVSIFNTTPIASNPRINALIQIIRTDTGQQIPNDNFLVSTSLLDNDTIIPAGQSIDVYKVTLQLSQYISDRQKALKLLYNAIKNSTEAKSLDSTSLSGSSSNDAILPGVYGNQNIPEVFEHMIEDETYDDYGPGSGARFIIKNVQIKHLNLAESSPDFTYVEVRGQLDPFLPNTVLPGQLNSFPQGGNGLVTAAAIDYDLWRKYGHLQSTPINVPFLQDPNTQCAPYASMILSRARKNIIRGSVTIAGNEYMQPGEVIFLEDRQLLFYVTAVRHNYSSGSDFSTTLDLAYGHTPGDYIPTTLDVIGKMIYSNRDLATTTVQRQSSTYNDSNIGVIVYSPQVQSGASVLNTGSTGTTSTNAYTASNGTTISNILYQAAYIVNANQTNGNTLNAQVELRIYYDSNNTVNSDLTTFANQIMTMLTTTTSGPVQGYNSSSSSSALTPSLPASSVQVVNVNLSDDTETRSPSQKAFDAARNLIGQNSTSGSSVTDGQPISTASSSANPTSNQNQIRISLFQYVVDCWLSFNQVSTNIAQSNTTGTNSASNN